jgi:hypothetical protein
MFVNEFFFSFSLLAFSAVLFVLGMILLIDGTSRLLRVRMTRKAPTVKAVFSRPWVSKVEVTKPS